MEAWKGGPGFGFGHSWLDLSGFSAEGAISKWKARASGGPLQFGSDEPSRNPQTMNGETANRERRTPNAER
jgi:hypothetical protein